MQQKVRATRHALWLWYRGDRFWGFQSQPARPTIQLVLTDAFEQFNADISFSGAGRTDRGAHARMQVLSVRAGSDVSEQSLFEGLARRLPPDVGICAVVRSPTSFHAQWSCVGKEYRYRLDLAGHGASAWSGCTWRTTDDPRLSSRNIQPEAINQFLRHCVGTHDFFSFHAKSSVRKARLLRQASLYELGDGLFDVRLLGDSFARYQVRYLIGSCVATAAGLITPEQLQSAIEHCAPIPGIRAPARALVLWEVFYPPALDPFDNGLRAAAPHVPLEPPFHFQ